MVEDALEVLIRTAAVTDAEQIARAHVASWREGYAGIVPADYLDALDVDRRADEWRAHLTDLGRGESVWVAQEGDEVRGFASIGPSTDEDADRATLEIHAIYLEPAAWGRGVARELMRTVLATVPPGAVVTLWALEANDRARHFYRRNGFQPDSVERLDEIGGQYFTAIRYRRG